MAKLSLGIIETVGLAAAIVAADTAVKTANVELVGYEISNGSGLVTVKIQGDVSSVNAAIKSASMCAEKVNIVFATTIIARPDDKLEKMIFTDETVGIEKLDNPNDKEKIEEHNLEASKDLLKDNSEKVQVIVQSIGIDESMETSIEELLDSKNEENNEELQEAKTTCNLCMDPKCPRKKGENRNICIHYNK